MSTTQRRAREREHRRRSILDAAREVFFESGFRIATVDDVAAQAEVSKGTVYLYFESKETILAHLLLEGLEELVAVLEEAFAAERDIAPQERLRRLAMGYLNFFQANPHYYRLIMALDRGQFQEAVPADLYEQVLNRSLRGFYWVVQAVQQGIDRGDFSVAQPRQVAAALWASLNGVLVLLGHPLRREVVASDIESLYWTTFDVMLRGLQSNSSG
ncbi:MAG: TetR/AcrR family transcriptional regulator [Anaerolineae bacterium]